MTYIEFYDKTLIENICSALANPPERVILIGDKAKALKADAERYSAIMKKRGFDVSFLYKTVNKNNLSNAVEILSEIVETYEDCVFDLTGGADMYLVAAGIVFERCKGKNIQMHRFNFYNNSIADCDSDGKTILEYEFPKLTVEENIRVYGGDVVYEDVKPGTTPIWSFDEEFADDIDTMWEVCREDVRLWNAQIGLFAEAEQAKEAIHVGMNTIVPMQNLQNHLKQKGEKFVFEQKILNPLRKAGLIDVKADEHTFSIDYKNVQIKKCLTKAGQALEMKIYACAQRALEKDGSHTYNDVMNGVYIDWDGEVHVGWNGHDTENEIDVMMMHGMIPVFVSCKNGAIDMNELYKLNTVATRFGGKYAKKVLVATALDQSKEFALHLRERAEAMNIRVIPVSGNRRIQDMDDADLQKIIRSFWCN